MEPQGNSDAGGDNLQIGQLSEEVLVLVDNLRRWLVRANESERQNRTLSIALEENLSIVNVMAAKIQRMEESLCQAIEENMFDRQRQGQEPVEERLTQLIEQKTQAIEERLHLMIEEKMQGFEERVLNIVEERLKDVEKHIAGSDQSKNSLSFKDSFPSCSQFGYSSAQGISLYQNQDFCLSKCSARSDRLDERVTSLESSVKRALWVMLPRVDVLLKQLERCSLEDSKKDSEQTEQNCSFETLQAKQSHLTSEGKSKQDAFSKLRPRFQSPIVPAHDKSSMNVKLLEATSNGEYSVVQDLLLSGADANVRDTIGRTPLNIANKRGDVNMMSLLLQGGADINKGGDEMMSLLHWSVLQNHIPSVKFLLEANARVNAKAKNGWTPLHIAVLLDRKKIIELLLQAGARQFVTDDTGNTPEELSS